jgi:hypothetical protein
MAIPCYISGKGMYATDKTRQFKVTVIEQLEATGMGYDTRYRYYQQQFPTMAPSTLAQMICDPIEYYDLDWQASQSANGAGWEADDVLTAFMLERDARFRHEAQVTIYCYDEAGFASFEAGLVHPLTGPIYVKGAQPGDVLEVEFLDIIAQPQAYIICSVAVDLRVSNVVDVPNDVVSALLPEDSFQG